jgi:uncharacterized membrane protein
VGIFSFGKPIQTLFSEQEKSVLVNAIAQQEKRTSGEIRLYIESHCAFVDPVDRAREVFHELKMDQTSQRNGVLIYIAHKDHQLAIFGDEGIYKAMGSTFWHQEVQKILGNFSAQNFVGGILEIISDLGTALIEHFPYNGDTDKNELSDDIVFGK